MRKRHTYKIDHLVIGSDLAALMYAYLNNHTFIFDKIIPPTTFEFLPVGFPSNLFNHESSEIEMVTKDGAIKFGTPKLELWHRLIFVMSAAGRLPFGLKEVSIRQKGKSVTIKTKSRNYNYEVEEIKKIKNTHSKIKVYDWIDVRSCGKIDLQYYTTGDDFVNELFFYPSKRLGAHKTVVDILATSELTVGQLDSFDFSETMSRLKINAVLKEIGIRGAKNGKNPSYPKSPEMYKYAPIKLEHSRRETRENKTNNSELDMVEMFLYEKKQLPEDSYLHRFNRRISKERLR